MEHLFLLFLFIFICQTTGERHLIYLDDEYEWWWSHMVWSQVAENWQRDWPRETARQIVIVPTNLTLSSERLRFLGKSLSACCPVSSSQLAQVCGWVTEWGPICWSGKVRWGCVLMNECGFYPELFLLSVVFIHLLIFFLTFSIWIFSCQRHSKPLKPLKNLPGKKTVPKSHSLSATVESPKVPESDDGESACWVGFALHWFLSSLV